jgi:hypothetical protein
MKKFLFLLALLAPLAAGRHAFALEDREACVLKEGQSLARILRARGVPDREMPKYFGAIRTINPGIRDIDRIRPGARVYVPTAAYFAPAGGVPAARTAAADAADAEPPPQTAVPASPSAGGAPPATPPPPAPAP